MKTTRSAALRAKPISWVTTIIVMPSLARPTMTSRTSLTISGSSADVGSSKSMTLGPMARDRAMATRCCWPPESCAGYLSACASTPTRLSRAVACWSASDFDFLRTLIGPRGHVLADRLVGEEVEGLEDHPHVGAQLCERLALLGERLA